MHKIIEVKALPEYIVRIRFDDGIEGEVQLSDLVGKGVFAVWSDPKEFAKVSIDSETHTLTWPGGIDLCPDALYEDIKIKKAS